MHIPSTRQRKLEAAEPENEASEEPKALTGLMRICRATECLNNLRNFVIRRQNVKLDELFERFESAVSLELEQALMRKLKRAIAEL